MEKEEILQKAKKKHPVGEMETSKINKSCWIALVVTVIMAVVLMIVEGALQHFSAVYAIAFICLTLASVFIFVNFSLQKDVSLAF